MAREFMGLALSHRHRAIRRRACCRRCASSFILVGYGSPDEDAATAAAATTIRRGANRRPRRALYYDDLADEGLSWGAYRRVFPQVGKESLRVLPFQGSFGQWCEKVLATIRAPAAI
ncbi:MAG: hypothetical protein QOI13_67 [Paraburkholderia sp.]|nr:hypothetical protein [Paraburkholderia sp.]